MCHETASEPEVKNAWSASYPVTGNLQERNGRDGNTSNNVERPVARHGVSGGRQQSHGGDGARAAGSSGRGPPQKGTKIVAQFDPSGVGLEAQRYEFDAPAPAERLVPVGEVEQAVDGARRDGYEDRSGGGGPTVDKPRWQALEEFRVKNFDGAEFSTGSPEALTEFVEWAVDHDTIGDMRYLLVLSGHGGGTSNDFLLKDENAQDALSMEELQTSLTESLKELRLRLKKPDRKFDILGFDACSMSMGEVAYQVRNSAHILVGAEGLEPAFGWPYRRLLANAKARTYHPDREALASEIVEGYVTHYHDYDRTAGRSADLSAIDLDEIEGVANAVTDLVKKLKELKNEGHNRLLLAHWYAQTYQFDQYVDLKDLCEHIETFLPDLRLECHMVKEAVHRAFSSRAAAASPISTRTACRSTFRGRTCHPTTATWSLPRKRCGTSSWTSTSKRRNVSREKDSSRPTEACRLRSRKSRKRETSGNKRSWP